MNQEKLLETAIEHGDDIKDHLPKLQEYASFCNHVTEFGVRDGYSTMALMSAKPARLVSYDINPCRNLPVLVNSAREIGVDFVFTIADDRQIDIEPTELLFIDTYHEFSQLDAELRRHAGKVSRYIVLHDTYVPAANGSSQGMWTAILKFLAMNPDWQIKADFDNCNGLTILERDFESSATRAYRAGWKTASVTGAIPTICTVAANE